MRDHDTEILRPATDEDAPAIEALTRAAYAKWVPIIGREPMPMKVDYAVAVRTHTFDLLEQDGVLVALVETIRRSDHLWIENLAVAPDHQGRGLGRRLLLRMEDVARSLGLPAIRLVTNPAFGDNVAFYQRAGFTIEREEEFRGGLATYLGKSI